MATSAHVVLRDLYLSKHCDVCYGLGEWRKYQIGTWNDVPELLIRKEIQQLAVSRNGFKVNNALISSVTELLKAWTFVSDTSFNQDPNILTFSDQTLNLITMQPREHRKEDYVTTKLPFDYDPTVRSQTWTQFLASTIPAYEQFAQEYAGYCLTASTRYELALWCWGPPGGGKSTFIAGLEAMLGPRSCVLGLNEIDRSQFALAQLPGKTLAVSTEQPSHFIKSPYILNSIISGEPILVDRKFRDHITVKPHAKLVWAMNELPRIDSGGVGLFRRVVPIYWPAIDEAKRDPKVREQISEDGMGIVNWALEGLQRLNDRGRFDIPKTLLQEREVYRVQNDVPQVFIAERCDRMEGSRIKSSELYEEYKSWCFVNGHSPLSSTLHAREMLRLGFIKHKYMDGNYWMDLELQPEREFNVPDQSN